MSQVDKLTKKADESEEALNVAVGKIESLSSKLEKSDAKFIAAAKEIQALKSKLESSELKVRLLEDRISDAEHADFSAQDGPETIKDIAVKAPASKIEKNPPVAVKAPKPEVSKPVRPKNPQEKDTKYIFLRYQFRKGSLKV